MVNFTSKGRLMGSLFAAALLAGGVNCASAQSINVLENMTGGDGVEYQPVVQAISPNHRYVAGPAFSMAGGSMGLFVYDTETDEYAVAPANDEMYGADIRAVNDEGTCVGYNGNAVLYSINGEATYYEPEAEGEATQARDASDDLSVVVGCHYSEATYVTTACVWVNGERKDLPVPSDDVFGFETNGSVAYYTNSDGSVIVGYVVDNYSSNPLVVWRLQENGEYECDPVCVDYFSLMGDVEGHPYVVFSPQGFSRNGRYVSLNLMKGGDTFTEQYMGRYDLETGELEEYRADGNSDIQEGAEMAATGVADDGTILGYALAGSWAMQQRSAVIWSKGEDAKVLANVYPGITEIAEYDMLGFNTAIDFTPDGRYIAGFANDAMYNYIGYVIDRGTSAGIDNVTTGSEEAVEVARYALDGTLLSAPAKGVNIVKMSDGTTKKVVVK